MENVDGSPSLNAELGMIDKIKTVANEARADFAGTNKMGKFALASMVAMTSYEWSFGNETVTPIIAGQSMEDISNPMGIVKAAAITGAFTVGQQLLSGYLARRTAKNFPKTAETAYSIMQNDEDDERFKGFDNLSMTKRSVYSMFFGSSFNVLREAMVTSNKSDENLKSVSRKSSLIAGTAVAAIVSLGGTVDLYVQNDIVQDGMEIAKNPLTWVGLGAAVIAKDIISSKIRKHKNDKDA